MSAVDKLINYIKSLTPEQLDKVEKYLPKLLAEPASKKEECISSITKAMIQTKDIALLDLIEKLLIKSN